MAETGTQAIDRAADLLVSVVESTRPLGIGELSESAGLPKSTTSRLVGALERRGLVSVSVGTDRRVRMAELTVAGHRLVDEVRPLWKAVQRDVRSQLGADRVARLMDELRAATAISPATAPRT